MGLFWYLKRVLVCALLLNVVMLPSEAEAKNSSFSKENKSSDFLIIGDSDILGDEQGVGLPLAMSMSYRAEGSVRTFPGAHFDNPEDPGFIPNLYQPNGFKTVVIGSKHLFGKGFANNCEAVRNAMERTVSASGQRGYLSDFLDTLINQGVVNIAIVLPPPVQATQAAPSECFDSMVDYVRRFWKMYDEGGPYAATQRRGYILLLDSFNLIDPTDDSYYSDNGLTLSDRARATIAVNFASARLPIRTSGKRTAYMKIDNFRSLKPRKPRFRPSDFGELSKLADGQ